MAERNNLSIYHLGTLIKDSRFQGTVSDEISSKLGAIKLLDSYIKHLEDQSSSLRSLDEKTLAEIGSSKQRAESIIQTKSDLVKTVQGGVGHLKSEVLAYLPFIESEFKLTKNESDAIHAAVESPPTLLIKLFTHIRMPPKETIEKLTGQLLAITIVRGNGWEALENMKDVIEANPQLKRFNTGQILLLKTGMNHILAKTADLILKSDSKASSVLEEFEEEVFEGVQESQIINEFMPSYIADNMKKALMRVWDNLGAKDKAMVINDSSGLQLEQTFIRFGEIPGDNFRDTAKDFIRVLQDTGLVETYKKYLDPTSESR